jgi:hypothetical protein
LTKDQGVRVIEAVLQQATMTTGSPYAHLPRAAVLALMISVRMPLLARLQLGGHDPWLAMQPPLRPLSGRVLHDSMPLAGATVSFTTVLLESGRAYGSAGTTDADDRLWLQSPREN